MNIERDRIERLFPAARQPRTTHAGLEHEMLTFDVQSGKPALIDEMRRVVKDAAPVSPVAFEPGGQIELNVPYSDTPAELMERVTSDLAVLNSGCEAAGIRLRAFPVDFRPETDVPLQLDTARYIAMQAHFDRLGPAGRMMMRRTASTQVCLDWWPGREGLDQWHVLLLAGPFLAAHFARTHGAGSRLATWLAVDPSRTAFDDRLLHGEDPVAAYTDFARHATPFLPGGDLDQHLTTLFPPVRPRGRYLEVRFPDAQEIPGMACLVTVLMNLMYNQEIRESALRRLRPEQHRLTGSWQSAAVGSAEIIAFGQELSTIAGSGHFSASTSYLLNQQPTAESELCMSYS